MLNKISGVVHGPMVQEAFLFPWFKKLFYGQLIYVCIKKKGRSIMVHVHGTSKNCLKTLKLS